jgi:hypothetical protein
VLLAALQQQLAVELNEAAACLRFHYVQHMVQQAESAAASHQGLRTCLMNRLPAHTLCCALLCLFSCRTTKLRVQFVDGQKEYAVIVAHACGGEVMVCRLPHGLEGDFVQRYQEEQADIKTTYLASLGFPKYLTTEQRDELEQKLSQGRYECHLDASWQSFARDSTNANHELNHIISVAPTGLAGFNHGMAAAKCAVLAAGGRCVAAEADLDACRAGCGSKGGRSDDCKARHVRAMTSAGQVQCSPDTNATRLLL